jgi:hypothetical protein
VTNSLELSQTTRYKDKAGCTLCFHSVSCGGGIRVCGATQAKAHNIRRLCLAICPQACCTRSLAGIICSLRGPRVFSIWISPIVALGSLAREAKSSCFRVCFFPRQGKQSSWVGHCHRGLGVYFRLETKSTSSLRFVRDDHKY